MSAAELSFTFLACSDLKRIWEGLSAPSDLWGASASENLERAERFAADFSRHCELLGRNPELGTPRDELQHGLRSLPFQRYVVFYRLRGERLEVLRVLRATEDVTAGA